MKKIFTVGFLFVFTSGSLAQISITSTDINALKGTTQTGVGFFSFDTMGVRAIVTTTGTGKVWNIAGFNYGSTDTIVASYLDYPGGAPLAGEFTSSNFVGKSTTKISGQHQTMWTFHKIEPSGASQLGIVTEFRDSTFKGVYSPPLLTDKFPTVFGTTWSSQTTLSSSGQQVSYVFDFLIDGEGTIVTPEGSFSCLRRRVKTTTTVLGTVTSAYGFSFIDKKREYAFIGTDANFTPLFVTYVRLLSTTAVVESDRITPYHFSMAQNYPNPFNPSTTIEYLIAENSHVRLAVFNTLGQEVAVLVSGTQTAGPYKIPFHASGLPSGVYLYRLSSGGNVKVGRMSLIK